MNKKIYSFLHMSVSPWVLLMAPGIVVCLATIFGFFGRFSWFMDLFSHFRVQYFLVLIFLGLSFLVTRHKRTAVVFIAFACINLAIVLPIYFSGRSAACETGPALRAMLLNVNVRFGDPERVKQAIREADPDILVLEEISPQWVRDLRWLANSHPYSCFQPRADSFGIGLFSKFPLTEDEIVYIGDIKVPSIVATVDIGREKIRVIATHPLPPTSAAYSRWRNDQFERLPDYVRSSLPTIFLGDLNVTPWNYHFKRLLRRTGLINSSQGYGIQPTWPENIPLLLIPLDYCLHSPDIFVVSKTIGTDVGSDHYPVIVDFTIKTKQSSVQ